MYNKTSRLDLVCVLIPSLGLPAIVLAQFLLLGWIWPALR
jgi:hypothetical protein